jgi:hypothetical protein
MTVIAADAEIFDPAMTTGIRVEAGSRFGGITIPSVFRASWGESEFFRAEITGAVFS